MKQILLRITSLTLVILMCFCEVNLNIVSASEPASAVSTTISEAIEVLSLFDIIPDYYDYNIDVTEKVTRADFASYIANLTNVSAYVGETYYYDVPNSHWAFVQINGLTVNGILNGNSSKYFRPDEAITYQEGYSIVIKALGYDRWADLNGGYPSGYLKAVEKLKLNSGVTGGDSMTCGDMLILLYNVSKATILEAEKWNKDGIVYSADSGETLLSAYKNIYYKEAVLSSYENICITGFKVGKNQAVIDNEIYKTDFDMSELIGQKIKFYSQYNPKDKTKTIKWAKIYSERDIKMINVNYDATFDSDTYTLTYYENQYEKKVKLSRKMTLIYNNECVEESFSTFFNLPKYTLKLVKTDNDTYGVGIISAYESFVVGDINSKDKIVYRKDSLTDKLELDENRYDDLQLFKNGRTAEFADIENENVLNIYCSATGKAAKIYITQNIVEGNIESIRKNNKSTKILVDDVEYIVQKNLDVSSFKVGDNVRIFTDISDEVVYIQINLNSYKPAYLINMAENDKGFSEKIKFRILNFDGTVSIVECAEKVKIDGTICKTSDTIKEKIVAPGGFKSQFVLIRTNKNGDITMIDTVNQGTSETKDDILKKSIEKTSNVVYYKKVLGHSAVLNSNSVIFSLPSESDLKTAKDTEFSVVKELTDWRTYDAVETFKIYDRISYEQFVVVYGNSSALYSSADIPIIVSGFIQSINEEGDIIEGVTGFQGNAEKTFLVDKDKKLSDSGVKVGDIIRLMIKPNGEVGGYTKIFDYGKTEQNVTIAPYLTQTGFSVGYVTDVVDDVIKIGQEKGATDISIYTSGVPCAIYDTEDAENPISSGSILEAKTYSADGDDCSMVFLVQQYGVPKFFVIYK